MTKKTEKTTRRSREQAQIVADKITPIFHQIEFLTDEDIEYLKDTARLIENENSTRSAVAGILIPLEKADAANSLGTLALERITGLVLIWSAIRSKPAVVEEYYEKAIQAKAIEKMFGV